MQTAPPDTRPPWPDVLIPQRARGTGRYAITAKNTFPGAVIDDRQTVTVTPDDVLPTGRRTIATARAGIAKQILGHGAKWARHRRMRLKPAMQKGAAFGTLSS